MAGEGALTGMPDKLVRGMYAAVLTPRLSDDSISDTEFTRLLEFLVERNVKGFAINGATGEFCLTAPQDLRDAFSILHKAVPNAAVLCGVGAAGTARAIELARIAAGEGAQAVLLPMPYFFPYTQEDLEEFVHEVASAVSVPVLLYNLPEFTTGLTTETVCRLIQEVPNVIGIKDSGNSLATLRRLTIENFPSCRMVGNDGILIEALREGICDGVVSGIACVLPELTRAILDAAESKDPERLKQLEALLETLKDELKQFPVPWGLKWIAEARGILRASFSQPVAAGRALQGRKLMEWFGRWQEGLARYCKSLAAME